MSENEVTMEQSTPNSDVWTVRDQRTNAEIKTQGYPTEQQLLNFKRKLGYGTIRVVEDNAGNRMMEFKPVDLSA